MYEEIQSSFASIGKYLHPTLSLILHKLGISEFRIKFSKVIFKKLVSV